MHYGMFYMHQCEQSGGWASVFEPTHQLFTSMHVKHTMLRIRGMIKKYGECSNKKNLLQ